MRIKVSGKDEWLTQERVEKLLAQIQDTAAGLRPAFPVASRLDGIVVYAVSGDECSVERREIEVVEGIVTGPLSICIIQMADFKGHHFPPALLSLYREFCLAVELAQAILWPDTNVAWPQVRVRGFRSCVQFAGAQWAISPLQDIALKVASLATGTGIEQFLMISEWSAIFQSDV